jgi:hypothetical protein
VDPRGQTADLLLPGHDAGDVRRIPGHNAGDVRRIRGGCPKDPWRCFETFPLNADDMEAPEKDPGWCWRLCNFFSFPITRVLTILAAGVVLFLGYHRVCEMSEEGVVQQPASSLVAFSYVDLGVDLPRQLCSST